MSLLGFLFFTLIVGNFAQDDITMTSRIIGGEPTSHVPYMVSLSAGVNVRQLICGGSLVSKRCVLTASHCIVAIAEKEIPIDSLRGRVGSDRYDSGGTTYSFTEGIKHPSYNRTTFKNDIAVLVTSCDVELTNTVSLISLTFRFIDAGVKTTFTGWGQTSFQNDSQAEILQKLDTVVMEGNECVTRVAERSKELSIYISYVDPRIEICTYSYEDERAGNCIGDPGSPLVLRDTHEQIGVMSWGIECAHNVPDMFVRISSYRDWIENTVQSHTPESVY